ncbi:hypothetical protein OIU78_027983 [Salix suchowensis]|nr:hypothetical protein OIU78_027983 [Salix suchowensis]
MVLRHSRRLGSVQVVTVDFVSYEGKLSSDDYSKQFRATVTRKLPELVAELNNSSGNPISCLLYDSHMPWVLNTARQLGLIGASLFTQSCAVDNVYYNIHEMQLKVPPEKLLVTVSRLPALSALDITDLPSEADWIFVNTFSTLEEEAVNWLASQRSIKPIGPMIPSFYLDKQLEDDKEYGLSLFKPNPDGCIEWLDSKETGSVALRVIWKLGCTGRGANGRYCLGPKEEWLLLFVGSQGIGKEKTSMQLCGGVIREGQMKRGSSLKRRWKRCIREVMEGERGNAIRRNSEKWMKLAKTAVDEGGSSDKNITEFAAELAGKFHETKDSKV